MEQKRKEREKMKTYKVNAELNGNMVFEVKAENMESAQKKVDELLSNLSVKEALEKYQSLNNKINIKEVKERER